MGNNFDITNTQQYTSVPKSNVSADDISKKQDKLLRIFGQFDLSGDGKLNAIELAKALDYFASFDTDENDGDGTISKDEFNQGAERLNQELGLTEKDRIKAKDIKKFISKIMELTQNDEHIDIKQLFFFLNDNDEDSEFDIQNLTNAEFDEEEKDAYTLTYASGSVVKVKSDKSYEITSKDNQGRTIVTSYNNNKEKLQETITDAHNNISTITYETYTNETTNEQSTVKKEEAVVYNNGDTETTQYSTYLGETIPVKKVLITNINGTETTSTTNYVNGVRVSEMVSSGSTERFYSCVGNNSDITQIRENIGSEDERITSFKYNDNNTITVSITQGTTSIKQVRAIPLNGSARHAINDESTITYESVEETTPQGIQTTEIIYLEGGRNNSRIERITEPSGKITQTSYNDKNHRLDSTVTIGGQTYGAEYDGKGHTYLIFTIDDPARINKIAASFGTTPAAIYALNSKLTHTDPVNGAKYFIAGTKIKIPTEVPADNKYLQARGSQRYEKERGNQLWGEITDAVNQETASRSESLIRLFTTGEFSNFKDFAIYLFEQEGVTNPNRYLVDARVLELKDMNPNLTDGNLSGQTLRFKYTAAKETEVHRQNLKEQRAQNALRLKKENDIAVPIAQKIYNKIDNLVYALQQNGGYKVVEDINSENVVSVLEVYKKLNNGSSLFDHINDEYDTSENDTYNKSAMYYIANSLAERCRNAGMNSENVNNFHQLTHDYISDLDMTNLNNLIDKMCSQCRLLENRCTEEINSSAQRGVSTNSAAIYGLDKHAAYAGSALDSFNANDETICGRLWEGFKFVCSFGTAHNLDEHVKADITEFEGYITQLEKAYKAGGERVFRTKFKEIFGVNFDSDIARAYAVKSENFQNAVAIKNITEYIDNFSGAWRLEELSYNNLVECCKGVLSKIDPNNKHPEKMVEELLTLKLGENHKNANLDQRRAVLIKALQSVKNDLNAKYQDYTGGKSIEDLNHELVEHSGDLFGNKRDMINRVNDYIVAQKAGDAYVSTALKVGAMAAFGLAGGGFALSFTGTFLSSLGIDVANSKDLSKDQLWEFTKEAALDGLFSGTGTFIRDGLKAGKFVLGSRELDVRKVVNITKGNASYIKTQGVLVGADSTVSTTSQLVKGGFKPENIGVTFIWSAIAHVGSTKIVGKSNFTGKTKSNVERCFRRTGKGGGKEQRIDDNEFSANFYNNSEITPETMKAQVFNYIANMTNLGNLNEIKRFASDIPEEFGKNDILKMINARQNELLANRSLITVDQTTISPEIRSKAIAALNQPAEHLIPEQIENILDYIDSISDPKELTQIMSLLQRHGIDFNEQDYIRDVLDDKFAELQLRPPYDVKPGSVLYASLDKLKTPQDVINFEQEFASQYQTASEESKNPAKTPILDKFNNNENTQIISQLDFANFYKIKEEIIEYFKHINSADDINKLIAKLDFLQNSSQKQELLNLISSSAANNKNFT